MHNKITILFKDGTGRTFEDPTEIHLRRGLDGDARMDYLFVQTKDPGDTTIFSMDSIKEISYSYTLGDQR